MYFFGSYYEAPACPRVNTVWEKPKIYLVKQIITCFKMGLVVDQEKF